MQDSTSHPVPPSALTELSALRRRYAVAPSWVRTHLLGRLAIAPGRALLDLLPPPRRVLDLGCGLGYWAHRLLLRFPGARILATDVDEDRISIARAVSSGDPSIEFRVGDALDPPPGTFDLITLVDVLYLLPRDRWGALFRTLRDRLAADGLLLIKTTDTAPAAKAWWDQFEERVATRWTGFTKGVAHPTVPVRTLAGMLRASGFADVRIHRVDRGHPHPHVALTARIAAPEPPPRGTLWVTADDAGLAPEVNEAIARAAQRGGRFRASLLSTAPCAEEAVSLSRRFPGIRMGLHLALSEVPAATPRGTPGPFARGLPRDWRAAAALLAGGLVGRGDVRREFLGQIERARRMGLSPTHFDGHQHLHLWPSVFPVVLELAERCGVREVRAAAPAEILPGRGGNAGPGRRGAMRLLGRLARGAQCLARLRGFSCSETALGMTDAGHVDLSGAIAWSSRVREGHVGELVLHPGTSNPAMAKRFGWGYDWENDLEILERASLGS